MYAREDGTFPVSLNSSEHRVVEGELADGVVAWYRNPTAGGRAIGIPYDENTQTMYPDLVVFREGDDGEVMADIIDPHRPHLADVGPKWAGPAAYADRHADVLGRVLAVIADADDNLMAVDLHNPRSPRRWQKRTANPTFALSSHSGAARTETWGSMVARGVSLGTPTLSEVARWEG